jgi:hypothetical protein
LKISLLRHYQRTPVFIHVTMLFEMTITLLYAQLSASQKTIVDEHFLAEVGVSVTVAHKNRYRTAHCNVTVLVAM